MLILGKDTVLVCGGDGRGQRCGKVCGGGTAWQKRAPEVRCSCHLQGTLGGVFSHPGALCMCFPGAET